MERADEQILPALYGFVAASFNIGPTQLGYLTLSRALVQAIASPLGGILGMSALHRLSWHKSYSDTCSTLLTLRYPQIGSVLLHGALPPSHAGEY